MKYERFEDVPVWQDGIRMTVMVFELTEDKNFRFKGDLANQLQRAALSVPNNIAEGFERGITNELLSFLYYAKGSAGEVRSICHVMNRLEFLGHLKSEISDLKSLAESVARQLGGWAASLQESDIRGQRHLTGASRSACEQKQRATDFSANLKEEHARRLQQMQDERRDAD